MGCVQPVVLSVTVALFQHTDVVSDRDPGKRSSETDLHSFSSIQPSGADWSGGSDRHSHKQ